MALQFLAVLDYASRLQTGVALSGEIQRNSDQLFCNLVIQGYCDIWRGIIDPWRVMPSSHRRHRRTRQSIVLSASVVWTRHYSMQGKCVETMCPLQRGRDSRSHSFTTISARHTLLMAALLLVKNACSDASIYRKYRYIVSISMYRIVSYWPPEYRLSLIYHQAQFLLLTLDFIFTDSNASNNEFSYDMGQID